jgi:hypothetical protein
MMIVECTWQTPPPELTAAEQKEYEHWEDEIHAADLLKGTGMTRVARFRNRDGSGIYYVQEFESEEAMEKYIVSDRRKELIHETDTHYPSGPDSRFFSRKEVKFYLPISSKSRE